MATIRRSTAADGDSLAALYRACREEADWLPAEAKLRSDFAADSEGEEILVALDDTGTLRGFISVWAPESFIHHLYVSAECRGQGIGQALLAALDGRFTRPWRLKCLRANRAALAFYQANGWQEVGGGEGAEGPYALLEWNRP